LLNLSSALFERFIKKPIAPTNKVIAPITHPITGTPRTKARKSFPKAAILTPIIPIAAFIPPIKPFVKKSVYNLTIFVFNNKTLM
jgi:hypothetical protein